MTRANVSCSIFDMAMQTKEAVVIGGVKADARPRASRIERTREAGAQGAAVLQKLGPASDES